MKIIMMLLTLLTLCSRNIFAQTYTQWGLPKNAKARLGKGSIGDIQYSPDGTRLAVSSDIGIWFYDTQTYQEVALLTGYTNRFRKIAFSPDGHTLASGGSDAFIRLWDVDTGDPKRMFLGHTERITSVAFSPDG